MSNVVSLHACGRCGEPGKKHVLAVDPDAFDVNPILVEQAEDGDLSEPFYACEPCIQIVVEGMAKQRIVFDALIGLGVRRDVANAMMILKMELETDTESV